MHTPHLCKWADARTPQPQRSRIGHIAKNSRSPVGRHEVGSGLPWTPMQEMLMPKGEEQRKAADFIFGISQSCTKLIEDGKHQQALAGLQHLLKMLPDDAKSVSGMVFKAGFGPDGFDALSHFGLHSKVGDAQVGLKQYKEAVESYKTAAEAVMPTMMATLSIFRHVCGFLPCPAVPAGVHSDTTL